MYMNNILTASTWQFCSVQCLLCQNYTRMSFYEDEVEIQRKENIKLSSIEYVEKLNKIIKTKSKLKKKRKVELKKNERANAHVNVLPLNWLMAVTHVYRISLPFFEFRWQQSKWRMAQKYKPSKRTRMRSVRLDSVWMKFSQQNKDDPTRGTSAKAKRW